MPSSPDGKDESRNFLREITVVAAVGCLLIFSYSFRYRSSGEMPRILGVGLLVAGAALLSGFLLGFIFAIPRVGDRKEKNTAVQPKGGQASGAGERSGSVPFNANLVEISDWLTKIIVGVGLVELHSIPARLGKLSYDLAPSLQPTSGAGAPSFAEPLAFGQAVGLAILIFYFVLGFLRGYVWTMIFFQDDLEQKLKDLAAQKEKERLKKEIANLSWWAEVSANANQLDEANDSIDKALKIDPGNGYVVMTKARILKRQALESKGANRRELLAKALAYVDQAITLLPEEGEPSYNKACYQALLDLPGLRNEVIENLRSAFRINPDLRQIAKHDEDLAELRHDADFEKLISRDQQPHA